MIKKEFRCSLCQDPDKVANLATWEDKPVCEKCDTACRKMDRETRLRWITQGIIKPKDKGLRA